MSVGIVKNLPMMDEKLRLKVLRKIFNQQQSAIDNAHFLCAEYLVKIVFKVLLKSDVLAIRY